MVTLELNTLIEIEGHSILGFTILQVYNSILIYLNKTKGFQIKDLGDEKIAKLLKKIDNFLGQRKVVEIKLHDKEINGRSLEKRWKKPLNTS